MSLPAVYVSGYVLRGVAITPLVYLGRWYQSIIRIHGSEVTVVATFNPCCGNKVVDS